MSAPELDDEADEDVDPDEEVSGSDDEESEQDLPTDDGDVEVAQTDVSETGHDPDGLFDDIDTSSSGGDSMFDGVDGDDSNGTDDDSSEAASTRSTGLAADINRGAARAGVIGLDDEWETPSGETRTKDELRTEFEETFEAFRLGHYGSEVIEEYLLVETDDIHPVWGLVGAMLICAAVIVFRRPDGDQLIDSTKMKIGQIDVSNLTDRNEDD